MEGKLLSGGIRVPRLSVSCVRLVLGLLNLGVNVGQHKFFSWKHPKRLADFRYFFWVGFFEPYPKMYGVC